jgi:hypothetical protein
MVKSIKTTAIVFTIIIIVAITFVLFGEDIWLRMPWKRYQAKKIATEYIAERYPDIKWNYEKMGSPVMLAEKNYYNILFVDNRNKETEVTVNVMQGLKEKNCEDNYISIWFSAGFQKKYGYEIQEVFKDDYAYNLVIDSGFGTYGDFFSSLDVPMDIIKSMNWHEIENELTYDVFVNVKKEPFENQVEDILKVIQLIQDSEYDPEEISFSNGEMSFLSFYAWKEIDSIEDIQYVIEEQGREDN